MTETESPTPLETSAGTPAPAIEAHGLTRCFGNHRAVDQVSLAVPTGGVFALLGRNGSGKSTMVKMMLGLLEPTQGRATVLGCDSRALTPAVRARIGYLPEGHPVYGWMRVRDTAKFQKKFFARWNQDLFDQVIEHFRISPKQRARQLSRGQRGGLTLALVLAQDPQLLIFDDPALGLDPVARRSLLEAMVYLARRKDRTVLFSSHYLDDVERVADRIAVIDRGVLRADCPANEFGDRIVRVRLVFENAEPPETVGGFPGLLNSRREGGSLIVAAVVAEPGRLSGEQAAAIERAKPTTWELEGLGLAEAITSYLDDRGPRPSFFERIGTAETSGAAVPCTAPSTQEWVATQESK
ncbi:MAG: ABC transporter ATP-binding protein [Planctomycetota bacterium]